MTDLSHKPFYRALDIVEMGGGNAISRHMPRANYPNRQLLICHERYGVGAEQPIIPPA